MSATQVDAERPVGVPRIRAEALSAQLLAFLQGLARAVEPGASWGLVQAACVDAIWPRRCWLCGCGVAGALVCAAHRLPQGDAPDPIPRCKRCALRLAPVLPDGTLCPDCRRRSPGFGRAVVLGDYCSPADRVAPGPGVAVGGAARGLGESDALREWILAFKHGGRRDLAALLGAALSERLRSATRSCEPRWGACVVPVPLHPSRRLERGYDQAALLATEVARGTGLELDAALVRVRATRPQGDPGAVSRRANVAGAFRLRRSAATRLAGRDVWLVDDVLTSGATASACATALRSGGVRRVDVLALARAAPLGSPPAGVATRKAAP